MKNDGFTLMELLSVLILISLITLLVSIPISDIMKEATEKLNEDQKRQIELAAENWVIDNPYSVPPFQGTDLISIELEELFDGGYLDTEIIDMVENKNIQMCSYVRITLNSNDDSNKYVYSYEFVEREDC